jgi:acetyl-CoA synthetase
MTQSRFDTSESRAYAGHVLNDRSGSSARIAQGMTSDPASRVDELIRVFDDPVASPAYLLCDRHPRDAVALTVIEPGQSVRDITFGQLLDTSSRVARALRNSGVEPGDRVATLMGKSEDIVGVMLGIWRLGAVYVPLFTAFAPRAISMRLLDSKTKVVVVDADQRPKLEPSRDMPSDAGWQLVVHGEAKAASGDLDLHEAAESAGPGLEPPAVTGGSGSFVHTFTSGTTGRPKSVVHPLTYVAGWQMYLEYALGVIDDDVYWCAGDPGWAYGLYAGIVAPFAVGRRTILVTGQFDPAGTWQVLSDHAVTNFAAAPTVYRSLRLAQPAQAALSLRHASSAGEPLTPEVNSWAITALGVEVHDHFGQTELGMVLANHHHPSLARPLKRGSMGRAMPGWTVTVLQRDEDAPATPGTLGRLAIDTAASPMMTFRGYAEGGRRSGKFTADGRWYLTGDVARVDADGDFFFSARDDDVIIMAGYRIGPFEVESVLAQHPNVAECAVIGAPDPLRGEVLEAYVVLRDTAATAFDELVPELQAFVKARYAAHAYPRSVHVVRELPKTPSGKIQRSLLRRRREEELARATTV